MYEYRPNYRLTKEDVKALKSAKSISLQWVKTGDCGTSSSLDYHGFLQCNLEWKKPYSDQYLYDTRRFQVNTEIHDYTAPGIDINLFSFKNYVCSCGISDSLEKASLTKLVREDDIINVIWIRRTPLYTTNVYFHQCQIEIIRPVIRRNNKQRRTYLETQCRFILANEVFSFNPELDNPNLIHHKMIVEVSNV